MLSAHFQWKLHSIMTIHQDFFANQFCSTIICMCRLVETMCIERINECPHAVGAYRIRPEYIRVDKWTHSGVCDTPLHGMFANIQ